MSWQVITGFDKPDFYVIAIRYLRFSQTLNILNRSALLIILCYRHAICNHLNFSWQLLKWIYIDKKCVSKYSNFIIAIVALIIAVLAYRRSGGVKSLRETTASILTKMEQKIRKNEEGEGEKQE